jgi:hypothetical protein
MLDSDIKRSNGGAEGQSGDGDPAVGKDFQYLVQTATPFT